MRDGRLEGLADLRDESDRQGLRLMIELQRIHNEQLVTWTRVFIIDPSNILIGTFRDLFHLAADGADNLTMAGLPGQPTSGR